MRLWPRSLAWRLIVLLLMALVIAQVVSILIVMGERHAAVMRIAREHVLTRTASLYRLLDETPPSLHERLTRSASIRRLRFWIASTPVVPLDHTEARDHPLARELSRLLDGVSPDVLVELRRGKLGLNAEQRREAFSHRRGAGGRNRGPGQLWILISVRTEQGEWLNVVGGGRPRRPTYAASSLIALVLMALATAVIVTLVARRITRPLDRLAAAAERLGRGEEVEPLPVEGPQELRRTIQAFNHMRERLDRYVQDRTRMLAAISHDLRTPITSLRLRAEFVDDEETRTKIIETLDEMQRMAEATLDFVREESTSEETRDIDLAQLLNAVASEMTALGKDVTLAPVDPLLMRGRPDALKRAIRNLVENAVAYGTRARVSLDAAPEEAVILIEDDGPGIPEAAQEDVFKPFVRIEASRSRETGGVGLGMAIARSIVRNHGGDITLENRSKGGLTVRVTLPLGGAT